MYAREDATMHVVIARSVPDIASLRADWLALREQAAAATPNTDPDRYLAIIQALDGDVSPYVAIFHDQSELQAALIGRISRRQSTARVGYLRLPGPMLRCLDVVYGGLITLNNHASRQAVTNHLEELLRSRQVDNISINHLPLDHPLSPMTQNVGAIADPPEQHWRFNLVPHSYEDTIKTFSKKHRYNIRRSDRLLVEHFDGDVKLRVFHRVEDLPEFAEGAAGVAAETYQAGLGVGFADTPLWRSILQTEAEHGRLRCYWLECQGRPVAFQVGTLYGGTYFLEAIGYLRKHAHMSPGAVLHVRVLQDLCSLGTDTVDYGFGDAEYKRIHGSKCWEEATPCLYGPSWRGYAARSMHVAAKRMTGIAKTLLHATQAHRKLKNKWRALLSKPSAAKA